MRVLFALFVLIYSLPSLGGFLTLRQVPGYQVVTLVGGIEWWDYNMEAVISDFVDTEIVLGKKVVFYVHYGPGGNLFLHDHLFDSMREKVPHITMIVGGTCASACAFLLPKADKTYVLQGRASVQIHSPHDEEESAVTRSRIEVDKMWTNRGVKANWFLENTHVFLEANAMYRMTEAEVLEAQIVDQFISHKALFFKMPLVYWSLYRQGWF